MVRILYAPTSSSSARCATISVTDHLPGEGVISNF